MAAGQRSRALTYFILILAVLTFVSIRNSYSPDWPEQEYLTYQNVLDCYVNSDCRDWDQRLIAAGLMPAGANDQQKQEIRRKVDSDLGAHFERLRPVKSASPAPVQRQSAPPVNMRQRHLEAVIEALQKRDIDNDVISIPILGTIININDLWLVSGALMFFLLLFLRTSLEQEYRSISYIIKHHPGFAGLAVMNQVLAPHALRAGRFGRLVELCVGVMPSILYFYLCFIDLDTTAVSLVYVGPLRTYVEYGFECALVLMVFYNNVRCLFVQAKIRRLIKPTLTILDKAIE